MTMTMTTVVVPVVRELRGLTYPFWVKIIIIPSERVLNCARLNKELKTKRGIFHLVLVLVRLQGVLFV